MITPLDPHGDRHQSSFTDELVGAEGLVVRALESRVLAEGPWVQGVHDQCTRTNKKVLRGSEIRVVQRQKVLKRYGRLVAAPAKL